MDALPVPMLNPSDKRLITIASGKGGVGKTWLSISLAQALALAGEAVILFDGDLGLANVDIQLGLTPKVDLGAFIAGDRTLDNVCSEYGDMAAGGFRVIAGRSGSGALGNLNHSALKRLRGALVGLTAGADRVILDLAAGIDPSVRELSAHGGLIVVVMTGDPTSLTDAYAFIKLVHQRAPASDIRVVVNHVESRQAGEKAYEAIRRAAEGFLKFSPPLLGIVRSDAKVVESIRAQMPILSRHPQSQAAEDIRRLAGQICSARAGDQP